jgi:tetratricopeptide (TPR) repeat protein
MISAHILQRVLDRLGGLDARSPHPSIPKRLTSLFRDLSAEQPPREPFETEDLIWAIWSDHEEDAAAQQMERAIQAMARKRYDDAEAILDRLVKDYPAWAEAWNKRATLYFILDQDDSALVDIGQALDLEPRHFGALSGLGMICERNGEPEAATFAYGRALVIHPHLDGIRLRLQELQGGSRKLN